MSGWAPTLIGNLNLLSDCWDAMRSLYPGITFVKVPLYLVLDVLQHCYLAMKEMDSDVYTFLFISIGSVAFLAYLSWHSHIFSLKFNQNTSSSKESFPHVSQIVSPASAFTPSKAACRPANGMLRLSNGSTVVCAILFQSRFLFSLWQKTAAAKESKQPLGLFPFGRLPAFVSEDVSVACVFSPCAQVHAGRVWNCAQERRGSRLHRRPDPRRAGRNAASHRDALARPPEVPSLSRDQSGYSRARLEPLN